MIEHDSTMPRDKDKPDVWMLPLSDKLTHFDLDRYNTNVLLKFHMRLPPPLEFLPAVEATTTIQYAVNTPDKFIIRFAEDGSSTLALIGGFTLEDLIPINPRLILD